MKKMRKLIPAFAMLMIAAIMMSTASYAWFTMSASVTAEGMQVKAQAAGGLVMSAAKAGTPPQAPGVNDYAATIDLSQPKWYTNGAKAIFPTSTNGTNWYTAEAASADSHVKNGNYTDLGATDITKNEDYYLATRLYFKAVVENADHILSVTDVTVTGSNGGNLDQALRVAMVIDGTWYYFAPNYAKGGTYTFSHATATDPATYAAGAVTVGSTELGVQLCDDLTSATAKTVDVYIYYEGEDENCKSAFAVDIQELTVSLSFTAVAK
jgi:hypothetical protein